MQLEASMKLRILIVILVAIVSCAVYLFFSRSNPVVYRYVDRASAQYSAFIIQNPFRDLEPELRAEAVLQRLKSRNCQQALTLQGLHSSRVAYLCEREQKYPLGSWSVMDRKDEGQKIQLIYRTNRSSGGSISPGAPAWINVEKINGEWQATDYETYY